MRPALVVELAPRLNQHLGFGQRVEPFPVEQFIAQLAVEALDEAVLPGLARRDEGRPDGLVAPPAHDRAGGELRPAVAADVLELAVDAHQPGERQDHILGADDQAFARVLVQQPQQPKRQATRTKAIDYAYRLITCHELQSKALGDDPKCEDCAAVVVDGDV